MPTKTSQYYNFTFRPTLKEFDTNQELFINNFKKQYKNEKYIVSREKGNSTIPNHFQGFIELRSEKRADTFRKSFNRIINKMDISYPKVALKITPIIRDVQVCQGYILKEIQAGEASGQFQDVIQQGYSVEYLLKVQQQYKELTLEKKQVLDKVRIKISNIYIIYSNYISLNKEKLKNYDLENCNDIQEILKHMCKDGYYMFDLLLNKHKLKRISFLIYELNNLKLK